MATEQFDLSQSVPTAAQCDACLDRFLERAQRVRGVQSIRPALDRRSADVDTDGSNETWREQLGRVGAGVSDGVVHETLRLTGLDCPSCAEKVEKAVADLPGVNHASVSYTSKKLFVEYDSARIGAGGIAEAVRRAGFAPVGAGITPTFSPAFRLALTGALLAAGSIAEYVQWPLAWLLLLPVVAVEGLSIFQGALASLKRRTANTNVLMAVAVTGAIGLGHWSEAAAVVWLAALGGLVQDWAVRRTRSAVDALLSLTPNRARLCTGEGPQVVDPATVQPGDLIEVHPGELFPLDGVILQGVTEAVESALTGESIPVSKGPSDRVFAGTVNGSGSVQVRVTGGVTDTALARMIRSIEESEERRAPLQSTVDRFAAVYTPLVVLLAALLATVPPLVGGGGWSLWISRSLWLLIVSCPCALVISTPVAVVAAVGAASRLGALVKGGAVLDALARARTAVFDKTGTLTYAALEVVEVRPLGSHTEDEVLGLAAAIESHSRHPAATAIVREAESRGLASHRPADVKVVPGAGMEGRVDGARVRVGRGSWLGLEDTLEAGQIAVYVARDDEVVGSILLRDTLRFEAAESIAQLRSLGIHRVLLLSGDKKGATAEAAKAVEIAEFEGGLMPEDKASRVRQLAQTETVIMVGDGINDLPALEAATVSVTMGRTGAEAAIEHGDVVLKDDRIEVLPTLIRLARRTASVMRQNIAFAILTKIGLVVLSVPFVLPLWLAAIGDVGVSLLVTLNAARLTSLRGLR
ncbi:MAG: putative cation-transporting ATPase G [Fimbriimonadales bacterium]